MTSSISLSSLATFKPRPPVTNGIHVKDLGSKVYEAVLASGRKEMTESECRAFHKETLPLMMALRNYRMAGAKDPLSLAREAVKNTQKREFDTRNSALADAVKSISVITRATNAEHSLLGNIARAEARLEGANASLQAAIHHVNAKDRTYINHLVGKMTVTAAMLERDFTVTGNILHRDEQSATVGEFELSHKTFGKLLSVDAQGTVTLFDKDGGAMDEGAYMKILFGGSGPFIIPRSSNGDIVNQLI